MPRWARFLSCSFTAFLISLIGFLLVAYWYEGGEGYFRALLAFAAEPGFWYLVFVFALMAAAALATGRLGVHLYRLGSPAAGALAGGLVALVCTTVIFSMHARAWGGFIPGVQRLWPSAALFALPLMLSGALVNWLWDRLD